MENDKYFIFLIAEFEKLKDEQHKRIAFRDQMIYLTLVAIGTIYSFSFEKPTLNIALLVLPFLEIIMGWTYYVNDRKISFIGTYIRKTIVKKLKSNTDENESEILTTWEDFVRKDPTWRFRKINQLLIDLLIFVVPGAISISMYLYFHSFNLWLNITAYVEYLLLAYLLFIFIRSANLKNFVIR